MVLGVNNNAGRVGESFVPNRKVYEPSSAEITPATTVTIAMGKARRRLRRAPPRHPNPRAVAEGNETAAASPTAARSASATNGRTGPPSAATRGPATEPTAYPVRILPRRGSGRSGHSTRTANTAAIHTNPDPRPCTTRAAV